MEHTAKTGELLCRKNSGFCETKCQTIKMYGLPDKTRLGGIEMVRLIEQLYKYALEIHGWVQLRRSEINTTRE